MQLLRLDWNIVFTIINLIVLYLLLKKFLIGPVTAIMQQRKDIIRSELADAKQKQEEADARKKQYEEILEQAHEESAQIIDEARKTAQLEYDKKVETAEEKAEEILEQAQRRIELEREKTMQELQSQIAGLALAVAGKVIGENQMEENSRFMYEQFLEKAGEWNDAGSR